MRVLQLNPDLSAYVKTLYPDNKKKYNMNDNFQTIASTFNYNASGNDNISTGLVIGSKDPLGGNDGNVGDLQRALNKLGGKPKLTVDGKFGTDTKSSVKSLNYSYPVNSTTFYKILSDANKDDASSIATMSEADMKKLWEKDKAKFGKLGKEPNFDKWIKRQKTLAGIKDFGKGLFTVAGDWLKQKSAGSPTGDDYQAPEPEDTSRIWGMPAPIVYVGSAIAVGLLIWGGIALATRKPKQVISQRPILATAT